MGKCKFSKDYSTFCSVCECDATPGHEFDCKNKICDCEIDPQKNIILAKENNIIFTIAEVCRAHYSLREDYQEIRKYHILKGQIKMTQEIVLPSKLFAMIQNCQYCGGKLKKEKFINY